MTEVSYCTREQVQTALNQADSTRNNTRIDAAILASSRDVEAYTHHRFYPTQAVRYPDIRRDITGGVLWLDTIEYELISLTSCTIDGTAITEGTDFYLDPSDDGPPYTSLRLLDESSAAFSALQRGIALAGVFGASAATRAAGALAGSISGSDATLAVTDSSLVGVGDLLTLGAERVIVTGKLAGNTLANLAADVTASTSERAITVDDGTLVHEGELISIGAERMLIEEIQGNTIIVRRQENGSVLAAHTAGDDIYARRVCQVERGQTGTAVASHSDGAAVLANNPPSLVSEAALAGALVMLEQGKSAYGRVLGSGDNQREASGRSLATILDDLVAAYGRIRIGATR